MRHAVRVGEMFIEVFRQQRVGGHPPDSALRVIQEKLFALNTMKRKIFWGLFCVPLYTNALPAVIDVGASKTNLLPAVPSTELLKSASDVLTP